MVRTQDELQSTQTDWLIATLCKIRDLPPLLGGKWQRGMLRYYSERLAEALLTFPGESEPSEGDVSDLASSIRELLADADLDGC
ncbi:hypothetical protein CMI37_29500 [Candidatus Pacearchaeota archaeon]|nr:hypothetical protein [Candidatus Pacearchaeota archaeon]